MPLALGAPQGTQGPPGAPRGPSKESGGAGDTDSEHAKIQKLNLWLKGLGPPTPPSLQAKPSQIFD